MRSVLTGLKSMSRGSVVSSSGMLRVLGCDELSNSDLLKSEVGSPLPCSSETRPCYLTILRLLLLEFDFPLVTSTASWRFKANTCTMELS